MVLRSDRATFSAVSKTFFSVYPLLTNDNTVLSHFLARFSARFKSGGRSSDRNDKRTYIGDFNCDSRDFHDCFRHIYVLKLINIKLRDETEHYNFTPREHLNSICASANLSARKTFRFRVKIYPRLRT